MKTILFSSSAILAVTTLLVTASIADARGRGSYGVSSSSVGRGTEYTTERGGSAYVGPRGVAAEGANGRSAAVTERGAAYSGPNGAAVSGRHGAAAVTDNGAAYAGRYGAAAVTTGGAAAVAPRPVLPAGYYSSIPAGYRVVAHAGYNCYYAGGVYYRTVFYGGNTVYVIVP